jgi:colicin import membrane protein
MTWVNALREYAKQTGKFTVPKRGTPEYEAVKKIQATMAAPAPEVKAAAVAKATEITKAAKQRKAKAAAAPTHEELVVKGVAEREAAKAAEAKAKAEAKAAKSAAKAAKAAAYTAVEEAHTEQAKTDEVVRLTKRKTVVETPKKSAPLIIKKGRGISVKADAVVGFA